MILVRNLRLDPGGFSVYPDNGGQVQLQYRAHFVEPLVIRHIHVPVPFRMGNKGPVSVFHHPFQDFPKVDRRSPGRGLYQDPVVPVREQVPFLQPLLKQGIHHVFGGQVQFHRSVIDGLQFSEA